MKKFAVLLALLLIQAPIMAGAATTNANYNYNKKPVQQKPAVKQPVKQTVKQNQDNDNDYLLKYNINDLEAAPWLNGGKRKI